ncbi:MULTISPECIES: hypothetical protein [Sphingobium]|uniref:hypothetical protein n=1 Tax=Sphingobium TaxID=165695 RepID=UPI0010F7E6B5|nr:hypothetical protein [Sphingobium sp. RSMS]UXC92981.1 hypothetical protein EGM87_22030 [Sphingobium sp. RSMS]
MSTASKGAQGAGHCRADCGIHVPEAAYKCRFSYQKSALFSVRDVIIMNTNPESDEGDIMTERQSRTYKLSLSPEGTDLFLVCHARLAKLANSLISYGSTLYVAILIAEASDASEIAAELELPHLRRLIGKREHFVGASDRLQRIAGKISDRLERSDHLGDRPTKNALYAACIALMASSEDKTLKAAYRRMDDLVADK